MKYNPGGYSWLTVAPESSVEQEIEKLEKTIEELRKEFEARKEEKILIQIKELEQQIVELKKNSRNYSRGPGST